MSGRDRIRIGTFGDLRSDAMTIHPTIAEHVRAKVDLTTLTELGENRVIEAYRDTLTTVLIQHGIVLDGDELYCSPAGLEPFRIPADRRGIEPIEDARNSAGVLVGGVYVDSVVEDLRNGLRPMGPDRLALAKAFDKASINGVGMSLGMWAGRGDWGSCSTASRDRAGHRALTDLDELIGRLTEFRQQLADATSPQREVDAEKRRAEVATVIANATGVAATHAWTLHDTSNGGVIARCEACDTYSGTTTIRSGAVPPCTPGGCAHRVSPRRGGSGVCVACDTTFPPVANILDGRRS